MPGLPRVSGNWTKQAAMKKVGDSEEAESFLAMLALVRGDEALDEETAAAVDALLKTEPDHLLAKVIRVRLQKASGEDAEAGVLCEGILEQYPDFTPAQIELASLYAQSSDPKQLNKAAALATKASRAVPDDKGLKQTLAAIEYSRKNYKAALEVLEKLEKEKALDAGGLFYLGMCQLELKQGAAARNTLQRALSEGLEGPLAKEARAAMVRAELER